MTRRILAIVLSSSLLIAPLSTLAQTAKDSKTSATKSTAAPAEKAAESPSSASVPISTAPASNSADASATKSSKAENADGAAMVENPYGLDALWAQGDYVARGTLIIMLIMSIGTWYIGIVKWLEQSKLMRQIREAKESFWSAVSVESGAAALGNDSAVRFIAESGLKADANHRGSLGQHVDKHTWIGMAVQQSVDTIQNKLQTGLAFLATVGSTAPFVGLFGTVWGIYHALTAIGVAGQASIDKVAGPVGEALIMTAIGLGAAVPAVMGYNWLVRRNKVAMEQVRRFAADIHAVLLSGNKEVRG
ncbi:MAG: MotA/TolQ/ExbB proton channel family protein [Betaproteobacteria bacterium]|nr:MotA/TolQ/ExbB proton channel family protein [Betaproteobacteria bacterium]